VARHAGDVGAGIEMAAASIDEGRAQERLDALIRVSRAHAT